MRCDVGCWLFVVWCCVRGGSYCSRSVCFGLKQVRMFRSDLGTGSSMLLWSDSDCHTSMSNRLGQCCFVGSVRCQCCARSFLTSRFHSYRLLLSSPVVLYFAFAFLNRTASVFVCLLACLVRIAPCCFSKWQSQTQPKRDRRETPFYET